VTPQERLDWWARTVAALEQSDPRVHLGLLVALILRHGSLEQCAHGHTHVVERISIEELVHTKDYDFSVHCSEVGMVEIQAVKKGEYHGGSSTPGIPGSLS